MSTSTDLPPPTYVTEADFEFYELGFLVAIVVFAGVNLMLIAAVLGLFIKIQNLQKKINVIMMPSKSLRPSEDLSKRYAIMGEKGTPGYQAETSGYQRREKNDTAVPSVLRTNDRGSDLYF